MRIPQEDSTRQSTFRRNPSLEELLRNLNAWLAFSETAALKQCAEKDREYPVVFVMGPLRSGTTLFMQWLANCGVVAYPTNLLSRFYGAPLIGAHIQLLLTDPRFNFRNEILDFSGSVSYESENGKTRGALAPNEFWYFWRRFLPFGELDWLPDEDLFRVADRERLVGELTALTRVFDKPFALKSMILNYNIPFLNALFKQALFVQIKRDPVTNVASILEARKRQLGSENEWYSFKIPEYPRLKDLDPVSQSAGQLHYINKAVTRGVATLDEARQLVVQYEDFCANPRSLYDQLIEKLGIAGKGNTYRGPERFPLTRNADLPNRVTIEKALAEFGPR
jgi:hypothetical protein